MEKTDVIALLYPHSYNCSKAIRAIRASRLHVPPRTRDQLPYLQISESDITRHKEGFVFGRHQKCDVVLNYPEISDHHFSLTFDDHQHLIVRDMCSHAGTQVTYNTDGQGVRRGFQWIVGGHDIAYKMENIIITVDKTISFQILVPRQPIMCPEYIYELNRLCQARVTADELGFSDMEPRQATETQEPDTKAIELRKELGQGSFGVVNRLWNVSTGSVCVVKEPLPRLIRNNTVDPEQWQREARIMGQISHPHIVRLFKSLFTPHPQLYLEYVPHGSLEDAKNISYNETLKIVCQCLLALEYLHGSSPPITHRDIKPDNILVEHRSDGGIYVKLGDFGLSKDIPDFMTICGTWRYIAPEMFVEKRLRLADQTDKKGFDTAVDIWSLGVVACELICGLPRFENRYASEGDAWGKEIVQKLQNEMHTRPNDLGRFLLSAMVIIWGRVRLSARGCYHIAMRLPSMDGGSHTSTPASYPEKEKQTTFHDAEGEATIIRPLRSYAGANAPSRSSAKTSRSRTTVIHGASEVPPPSSAGRHLESQQDQTSEDADEEMEGGV